MADHYSGYRGRGRILLCVALASSLALANCQSQQQKAGNRLVEDCQQKSQATAKNVQQQLQQMRSGKQQALERAKAWLDHLHLDPLALRRHRVLGIKKLGELLYSYYQFWRVATPIVRKELLPRIQKVSEPTDLIAFHDMAKASPERFRQESLSYLRVAYLLDRFGLLTPIYREQIGKIQPRLDAHLSDRGPHQQQTFAWYYEHFRMKPPFDLNQGLRQGLIAKRQPIRRLFPDAYTLTHEVYAAFRFGDQPNTELIQTSDIPYLHRQLKLLTAKALQEKQTDILAELLSCLLLLHFYDAPALANGIFFLVENQNRDGSWDTKVSEKSETKPMVRNLLRLHTTSVALEALTLSQQKTNGARKDSMQPNLSHCQFNLQTD